ncbi:MAG: hypothetical protein AAB432_02745 [Patescibacteria group bacterium]
MNKFLFFRWRSGQRLKVCPICAGVFGTWLWMLVGALADKLPITDYQLPIAILMGGSVVGVAYALEKRLPPNRSSLLWKMLFTPIGFIAVYSILSSWWFLFITFTIILAIFAMWFTKKPSDLGRDKINSEPNRTAEQLKKKMEDCC